MADECQFSHSADAQLPPCKYGKQCRFGSVCMFGHPEKSSLGGGSPKPCPPAQQKPYSSYQSPNPSQYYAGSSTVPMGSSAGYSRVPTANPYSMNMPPYTQFPATAYGPYGSMPMRSAYPSANSQQRTMQGRTPPSGRQQPPMQNPSQYAPISGRGGAHTMAGGRNPPPTMRSGDVPQSEPHGAPEDPEIALCPKIQGMAII